MALRSKVPRSDKTRYRVTNWREYEQGLVERGSLTIWFSPDALKSWKPRSNGGFGGQRRYFDGAIALALQLRLVFKLPWRQTEGLLRSLLVLLRVDLDVPGHTTFSRRSCSLRIKPSAKPCSKPIRLIIDATGLKVFGQGEWARAKHDSAGGNSGWRKLHIGIDGCGFIVTADLADSDVADATVFPRLVRRVENPIKKVTTDGAYDHRKIWKVIDELGAHGVIPLHRRATLRNDSPAKDRSRHLRRIRKVGRAQWRRDSGQHKQAKVENAIGRFKKILGSSLRARCPGGQRAEVMMGVEILNRMLELGAPRSVPIER